MPDRAAPGGAEAPSPASPSETGRADERNAIASSIEHRCAHGTPHSKDCTSCELGLPAPPRSSEGDDGPLFDDDTLNSMMGSALRVADDLDAGRQPMTSVARTIRRLVRHLRRERHAAGPRATPDSAFLTEEDIASLPEWPAAPAAPTAETPEPARNFPGCVATFCSRLSSSPSPASEETRTICSAPTDVCEGTGKGCGREIPRGEEYRCLDCGGVMHKDCLRWHCSGDEKDRRIWGLEGQVKELRAQIERICEEPASSSPPPRSSEGDAERRRQDFLSLRVGDRVAIHDDGYVEGTITEVNEKVKRVQWDDGDKGALTGPSWRWQLVRARSTPTPETSEPAHPSSGRTD